MMPPSVRVKFLSRLHADEWRRYFPAEDGVWRTCTFLFDRDERNYDWLVALDDVPSGTDRRDGSVPRDCPRNRTVLITTEPPAIKAYGRAFAAQFGHVLTSQPDWALPHPRRHFQQAANRWFYGSVPQKWMSRARLLSGPTDEEKVRDLSVVYSAKRQWHTLHAQRFRFIASMREHLPDMAVFGRGATPMQDKAESLDSFRYHLAVENHIAPHHFTEKLSDAFLGRCLPFYAGASNAAEYFPEGSFVPVDIRDPSGAAEIIRRTMATKAWEERRPLIEEARRRVLEEHHLFAVTERIIRQATEKPAGPDKSTKPTERDAKLLSRHAWRRAHPIGAVLHAMEKLRVRGRSIAGW